MNEASVLLFFIDGLGIGDGAAGGVRGAGWGQEVAAVVDQSTVPPHLTVAVGQQPEEHPQQRGLARADLSGDDGARTRGERELHIADAVARRPEHVREASNVQ